MTNRTRSWIAYVVVALLLAFSLIWLGNRSSSFPTPANWFDAFRQSAIDLFSQQASESDVELESRQTRYDEIRNELDSALHSDELTRLTKLGRPRLNQRISLTLELARDSREGGDLDSALRLLEKMVMEWHTAVESIDTDLPPEISESDLEGSELMSSEFTESAENFEPSSAESVTAQNRLSPEQTELSESSQFGSQKIIQSETPVELQTNTVEEELPAADINSLPLTELAAAANQSFTTATAQTSVDDELAKPDSLPTNEDSTEAEIEVSNETDIASTGFDELLNASEKADSLLKPDSLQESLESESVESTVDDQSKLAMVRTPEQVLIESFSSDIEVRSKDSSTTEQIRQEQEKARETYLNLVKIIDEWLVSRPANQMLPTGLARTMETMIEIRNKAEDAYRESDFMSAERLIELADTERNKFIEREFSQFQSAFKAAQTAYESENYEMAKDAIESAYSLRPNDEEVIHLGDKISMLPDLLIARQDAASARSTGHLTDELAALERVLIFAPRDADAANRMKILRQQQSDLRFHRSIGQGLTAVGKKDVEGAKLALAKARKERPSSSDVSDLQKKIVDLELQLKVEENLTAANKALLQDDWQLALQSYGKVLAIDSEHNEAAQGSLFAKQIIDAQKHVDEFLAQPHRLSSPNIAEAARKTISEVNYLTAFSAKLSKSIDSLDSALVDWTTFVPIRVVSDGETEIGVRGVGKIGKTKERFVELRPGTYVFEGQREGYRSILVEVAVATGNNRIPEVTVICSEQI